MRVITGSVRGRKLKEPAGKDIRPTTDKVKESVFNIIQFRVPGARVLDLFAGTGQMGIEALSRGAAEAVFVDRSREAVKLVRDNLAATGLADRARVVNADSLAYLKSGGKFDVVYMDPPYEGDTLDRALAEAAAVDILRESGIILCECEREKTLAAPGKGYEQIGEYRYGRIKIVAFGRTDETARGT